MNFNTSNQHLFTNRTDMTAKLDGFNPFEMMLKRKHAEESGEHEVIQYDPEDIAELEEFCQQHGVMGFSCGKMSPKAALAMLKGQMGMVDDVIKSRESMGWTVAGKDYPKDREILNG